MQGHDERYVEKFEMFKHAMTKSGHQDFVYPPKPHIFATKATVIDVSAIPSEESKVSIADTVI